MKETRRCAAWFCAFLLLFGLLAGCGGTASSPQPEETSSAAGAGVAGEADMAAPVELDLEGLTPLGAEALRDGSYSVSVDCSSSMFRIVDCVLTVENGAMTALMTMSGTSYLYVYPGTGEEASAASEDRYIPYAENAEGAHTFTIPVQALDAPVACAAFSKNKELWYDRTLVFRSDSLPLEAFADGVVVTAEDLGLADGEYTVEVSLEGGSGRASVTSPTKLTVTGGAAAAVIEWSSPNYDYMKVDGVQYDPVNEEGNSAFEIPVAGFDIRLPVLADTTAMSVPHEIEYTLLFDAASIRPAP